MYKLTNEDFLELQARTSDLSYLDEFKFKITLGRHSLTDYDIIYINIELVRLKSFKTVIDIIDTYDTINASQIFDIIERSIRAFSRGYSYRFYNGGE